MATYQNREAFIPMSRQALIELCLSDNLLSPEEQEDFQEFCRILAAYYHFQFHSYLENIKQNYAPFNPDRKNSDVIESEPTNLDLAIDEASAVAEDADNQAKMTQNLIADFTTVLEKANYFPLSQGVLNRALAEDSLFNLKTEVDFGDFAEMVCYCQGDIHDTIKVKKLWKTKEKKIDIFERVVLLIKFKSEQHFTQKPTPQTELTFKPGSVYIYLYKNLSKLDLEFIFPNVQMSMNWKDRLFFGVPAFGAGIALIIKILPQLLLIAAVFFYVFWGEIPQDIIAVGEDEIKNLTPLLVTSLSLLATLGGFAFKQYNSYKNKQIKFQKNITETLFFRNMASNVGVFQYLIDAAEEEECKQIILVYYHLLTSETRLNAQQLDNAIEEWMSVKTGHKIDFDIEKTLKSLAAIRGKVGIGSSQEGMDEEISLLKQNDQSHLEVISLSQAMRVIDYVWDNAFDYVGG